MEGIPYSFSMTPIHKSDWLGSSRVRKGSSLTLIAGESISPPQSPHLSFCLR